MKSVIFSVLLVFSGSLSAYTLAPGGEKWGSPIYGTGATITYSFISGGVNCDDGICTALESFMPSGFKTEIEKAFDAWSAVADLTFLEVADDGADFNASTGSGDIRIGGEYMDGSGGELAHAYYPATGFDGAGDLFFDSSENWHLGIDDIFDSFSIFIIAVHEIGHSIGIGHSDILDSIMAPYYDPSVTGLRADDIAAAQYLYGAPVVRSVPTPSALWLFLTSILAFGRFCFIRKQH